jgi:ribosomal protein S18 acetylase RimI-like enzyme
MLATLELARRIERAEIDFCALATMAGGPDAASLDCGGGRAVYAAPGSPVNKVLGLGLGTEVTDDDIDAIEEFYAERGCPVQIELCPLVTPDLPSRLTKRGYVLQAFENELARTLEIEDVPMLRAADTPVESGADAGVWLDVVSRGFATPERAAPGDPMSPDTVRAIGDVMRQFVHSEVVRYVARVDGTPAAAGLSFLRAGVLGIFGTATIPEFRRRGLQRAIVAGAMRDAIGRADIVMATTEPGSASQRTFERLGFQVLYTRSILVKY